MVYITLKENNMSVCVCAIAFVKSVIFCVFLSDHLIRFVVAAAADDAGHRQLAGGGRLLGNQHFNNSD